MTPEEEDVFAPVAALFRALANKDAALIREVLGVEGSAALYRDGRFLKMSLATLAERLVTVTAGPGRFEERMEEPLIRIDENIAVVWGAYIASQDGIPHHRGSNLISLIKEDGRWRITGVTDTSRSCDA